VTGATPSQTVGPFFRFGLAWMGQADLVAPGSPGAVTLGGQVLDGDGAPVPDAVIEIWQADPDGRFPTDAAGPWHGFGRSLTDDDGRYHFTTVRPGRVDDRQAPHIDVSVFARGLLQRLVTRAYLPDEVEVNGADPVLAALAPDRRATLVAEAVAAADGPDQLRFDIRLQGDRETVFFAW
jgi:protocatechuate 3,4-dioxygenase alpha subunit